MERDKRTSETGIDEETRAMVRQIREVYTPEPVGSSRRAALLSAIEARAEQRPRRRFVAAVVAGAAVAAVVAWLVVGVGEVRRPSVPHVHQGSDRWIEDVVFRGARYPQVQYALPAEYAALDELLPE
jgi:hypothetical protein